MSKPEIHHGKAEEGLQPPKQRKFKHRELVEQILALEPGDYLDLPIPKDRGVTDERRRISRVIDRHIRSALPEYLFKVRLTETRRVRVSCHARPRRGKLSR